MDDATLDLEIDHVTIVSSVSARFIQIYRFRTAMRLGLQATAQAVHQNSAEVAQAIASGLRAPGGIDSDLHEALTSESFVQSDVQAKIADLVLAVDSASLIFAHSMIDGAAYDLCVWTSRKAPRAWESAVGDSQVSLKDLRAKGYDSVLRDKVEKFVSRLEFAPLLTKLDLLMQVCKPTPDEISATDFRPDREKLARLDKRRHDVVHHSSSVPLPDGEHDLEFLHRYTEFLCAIARARFSTLWS